MILHQTSFDGALYWSCLLTRLQIGDEVQFNISVSHETKASLFEDSVSSSWKFTGLETYLVCNGENKWMWRSPNGNTIYFGKDLLSRQKIVESNGCKLAIVSKDKYIVTDTDATQWVYERGSLTLARFASGVELSFKCSNGLIRELARKGKVLLGLQQQDSSLVLFAEGRKIATIEYDKSGRLIESITFEDKKRLPIKFSYQNNNLATITEGDAVTHEFIWRKVSFLKNYFSALLFPYYLCSDGHYTYDHKFYFGNATMSATDMSGRREEKILNLKSGVITDRK